MKKFQIAQYPIERSMIGLTLTNNVIRQRTRGTDVVERITNLKWSWMGHVVRIKDDG